MVLENDRRREARIKVCDALFEVHFAKTNELSQLDKIQGVVTNLSRLGIGVEFADLSNKFLTECCPIDTELKGILHYAGEVFSVCCVVRAIRSNSLGLEFTTLTPDVYRRLRRILTPGYIARDIFKVSAEHLGEHIQALYRGDDFECTIFRSGVNYPKGAMQILWRGKVAEIVGDKARFVPGLLLREGGEQLAGANLLKSFSNLDEHGSKKQLQDFFVSLNSLISVWPDCPQELKIAVKNQIEIK